MEIRVTGNKISKLKHWKAPCDNITMEMIKHKRVERSRDGIEEI